MSENNSQRLIHLGKTRPKKSKTRAPTRSCLRSTTPILEDSALQEGLDAFFCPVPKTTIVTSDHEKFCTSQKISMTRPTAIDVIYQSANFSAFDDPNKATPVSFDTCCKNTTKYESLFTQRGISEERGNVSDGKKCDFKDPSVPLGMQARKEETTSSRINGVNSIGTTYTSPKIQDKFESINKSSINSSFLTKISVNENSIITGVSVSKLKKNFIKNNSETITRTDTPKSSKPRTWPVFGEEFSVSKNNSNSIDVDLRKSAIQSHGHLIGSNEIITHANLSDLTPNLSLTLPPVIASSTTKGASVKNVINTTTNNETKCNITRRPPIAPKPNPRGFSLNSDTIDSGKTFVEGGDSGKESSMTMFKREKSITALEFGARFRSRSLEKDMALSMASDCTKENVGHPVQIIDFVMNRNRPSKMNVNNTNLRFILNNVGDHNISLISIAGPSRLGKSFLLSLMVRYLGALEKDESADWIGSADRDKTLEGFPFQNGIERMTTGIWLWSRPFFVKNAVGKEIAVLLMDTQGVFDDHTTMKEWSAIVGISLLTSSCLIYNVVNNLQEDALAILETFMQFGILAMENSESAESCFQKLVFLIRDWNMPDDCEYGPLGGQKFLDHKLQIQQHLPPESIRVRQTLRKCFEEIDCFLMPDPGKNAKSNDFRGSLAELDEKFVKNLLTFMDSLISPEEISVKKVDGQPIKGKDLLTYFQRYVTLFNSSETLSPTNMLDATAYASCDALVSKCLSSVHNQFLEILERKGFVSSQEWEPLFSPLKIEAMKMYDAKRKFGDPKIASQQRRRLEGELLKLLTDIKGKNEDLINQNVDKEILKLTKEFFSRINNILGKELLMKEELESIIFQETESVIKNFCNAFGQYNEILERNIPFLTKKINEVANQFRTGNDTKIEKATQVLNAAVEQSFRNYYDNMDLRILSTGEGTICDDILLKLDTTFRDRAFSYFQALPKDGPEGIITKFRTELEMKINEKFEGYAAENSKKRAMQKSKTEELIDEIKKMYLEEMSKILSREAAPDNLFLENRHFQLQQKYFDMFMSRCEIQEVICLIPFRQMLSASLQDALEMARHQLFKRQNEVRNNILMEIEKLVENHHKSISDLLNERQVCTEQHLRNTHENITKSCQSNLNFPSFLTSKEREDYNNILFSHLKQDFELLHSSYENKFQEANDIAENNITNIIHQYHEAMECKVNDAFDISQLDEYHSKEKNKWVNELLQNVTFFSAEILNQYQKKLAAQLDEAYEIIVEHFEANLSEINQKVLSIYYDTISQYSIQMEMRSKASNDRDALSEWHDLYKEKAMLAFDRDVRTLKINCDHQSKKLERQLSEEFKRILLLKNADEQEINDRQKTDKHLHDALAKFNRDASNLLEDKSLKADAFSKKLNEIKIIAGQYFYENSSGISREIMSARKVDLDEQIEKCYNKISDDFMKQKEEEALFIDTTVVKSVSYYQSKMDETFQDFELLEMENFVHFHKKSVKEAMQKIPDDCLDLVSQIVQQEIDSLYEKYKKDQIKRLEEAANDVTEMMNDLKNNMTNAISQKSKAAQDPKDLLDLTENLKANAHEMLKFIRVSGGKSKQSLIDEMEKHLQDTIVEAEKEIKTREH